MLTNKKYIDVILPLNVKGVFTYSTDEKELAVGQRVVVQFGKRKLYTALVKTIHNDKPIDYDVKPILAILDDIPIVNSIQLRFWQWIATYYMCSLGDIMKAALPASFKLASESKVIINNNFDGYIDDLSSNAKILLDVLSVKEELNINDISTLLNIKQVFSLINELIRKEVILVKENLYDRYKEKEIRVARFISSEKKIRNIKLTPKQNAFITRYLQIEKKNNNTKWLVPSLLSTIGFSRSVFNALVRKEIFSVEKEYISRLAKSNEGLEENTKLADFQLEALDNIKSCFQKKNVCLLHGVTSSGKTELYIKLIREQLDKGKQVLYLLPEIALTTQIIRRLQKSFGDDVGITHSHLNNAERLEIWKAVKEKDSKKIKYSIILGTRSSLFLPFDNLGLIIIDEEHDSSFKQHQVSPRYHARDVAIYLASLHQSNVLLGSATPSMETYWNTKKKKYSLVSMNRRFSGILLPKIQTINIRKAKLKQQMIYNFSNEMIDAIKKALVTGMQVILFQNRRGYSPILSCDTCSYIPTCKHCDVSLTYHKWNSQLQCHYCSYTENIPKVCPSCSNQHFSDKGFGTEQIEENLNKLFPDNIIKRMDYDTTRGKYAYQKIINDFEKGRIDILVGTQMITKGLDFDNVALVGVLDADSMLYFPDFRSYERAFQLMVQVSGRAGRKHTRGKVLIQTYDDQHEIFEMIKKNDYISFIKQQSNERRLFNYPPYNKIITLTLKDKNQRKLDKAAFQTANMMRKSFGNRVLGPQYPVISKIRDYYHKGLLLKIEKESSISNAKNILNIIIEVIGSRPAFKSVRFIIDVDPI